MKRVLVLLLLAFPSVALADNCSGFGDCFYTLKLALSTAVGLAIISLVLDFIPFVGTGKGIVEAFTGEDLITGEKLENWERVLGVIPFIGGVIGGVGVAIRHGDEIVDALRQGDKIVEAGKDGTKIEEAGKLGDEVADTGKVTETVEDGSKVEQHSDDIKETIQQTSKEDWIDESGNIIWPKNDGFLDEPSKITLEPGTLIDRYGYDDGFFVSPKGTPYSERSLPPGTDKRPYNVFEVIKPIDGLGGKVAPYFGEAGNGTQYLLENRIKDLIEGGFIKKR